MAKSPDWDGEFPKMHTDEGSFQHREEADENGNPSISSFDEAMNHIRQRAMEEGRKAAQGKPFESIEEMMQAMASVKPVDDYQQQVLNAMKTQQTHIILLFGPGHGQTMTLGGPPADEIVWQEASEPTFQELSGRDAILEDMARSKRNIHRYRLSDEMESAQMEEVAIYVHHERCCEKRFDRDNTTARHERMRRPAPDVFNKPYLRNQDPWRGAGRF